LWANQRRSEPRIPTNRRATLEYDLTRCPCIIQDASTAGFFIVTTRSFSVGQQFNVSCEFDPPPHMTCTVEVRHVDEFGVGARIVGIDKDSRNALMRLAG
jgi:hypothetical protein